MAFQGHEASGSKFSDKLPSWNKSVQIPWAPRFIKTAIEAGWRGWTDHILAAQLKLSMHLGHGVPRDRSGERGTWCTWQGGVVVASRAGRALRQEVQGFSSWLRPAVWHQASPWGYEVYCLHLICLTVLIWQLNNVQKNVLDNRKCYTNAQNHSHYVFQLTRYVSRGNGFIPIVHPTFPDSCVP